MTKNNIPPLFQEIVSHDRQGEVMKKAPIVSLNAIVEWRKRKRELLKAADLYFTGKEQHKGA
jgi:hypothetical protein